MMPPEINLRPMTEADLPPVYDLIQNTIKTSYAGIYPPEAIDFFVHHHSLENILKDFGRGYIIVAEKAGKIIGTGTLVGNSIRRVFVNPDYQGKGTGVLLAAALERQAKTQGFKQLDLDSSLKSVKFWESQGFTSVKEVALPVGNGQNLIYIEMVKDLP